MTILSGKRYLVLFTSALILGSCGWILEDHRYDYLKEKQSEPIEISSEQSTRPIIDFYPIPRTVEDIVGDS